MKFKKIAAIRSGYFEIDHKTKVLTKKIQQSKEFSRQFNERFELSWIYHENAMEGLVLDVYDLKAALDHATSEDGILVPTYQRIRNHKQAIQLLNKQAKGSARLPSLPFIKNIHSVLGYGLSDSTGGTYRKDIPIHRMYFHDIIAPTKIPSAMKKLMLYMKSKEFQQLHPIRQASEVHLRMMKIFPFDEETGKVVRLVMNFFVIHAGYFPIIIPDIERQRYFDSLRLTPLVLHDLMVDCMRRQLDLSLRVANEQRQGRPYR